MPGTVTLPAPVTGKQAGSRLITNARMWLSAMPSLRNPGRLHTEKDKQVSGRHTPMPMSMMMTHEVGGAELF
jgi:hypothetical protein